MAVPVFGIDETSIRGHFFPQLAAFGTGTQPTKATVLEMVTAAAGVLGGRLKRRGLAPATVSTDAGATYPLAYAWCQRYIRTHAGIATYRAMTGGGSVPRELVSELESMEGELEAFGLDALGDAPAPAQDAQGPRTHIENHSLDTGDETDISDAVPHFRMGDEL